MSEEILCTIKDGIATVTLNRPGLNRASVTKVEKTYFIVPARNLTWLACSLTSESNPAPPTFTKYRSRPGVFTRTTSIALNVGAARRPTAASGSFRSKPRCRAKSFPVTAGMTASAAAVPISPLATAPTWPSPPNAATTSAPSVAASRPGAPRPPRSCRSAWRARRPGIEGAPGPSG